MRRAIDVLIGAVIVLVVLFAFNLVQRVGAIENFLNQQIKASQQQKSPMVNSSEQKN